MNLDKYQLEAVHNIGNTLLIAGAGSGKTTTILKRIEYLIESNIFKVDEILVISFTNKSVDDLKKRCKYQINIKTFHKLAMEILDEYNINYKLVSEDYLLFLANEFFITLTDTSLTQEIIKYFGYYNYQEFLKTYAYKEFIKLICNLIKLYKSNNLTKEDIKKLFNIDNFISKYMYIIFCKYNQELKSFNGFDFDDLILEATKIISKKSKYKHIIIDEFQDTSLIRFNLINKIRVINNATLFCVGDDYQSIYHFSGSDINLFLKFREYINDAKVMKLKYTYRNSQELINASTSFVMKNNKQLRKELISNKHIDKPIKFIYYINPYKAFKKLYKELNNNNLLVLGRNNFDIKKFSKENIPEFMSVHSSKGLEADNVILINMVDNIYGFPNKLINSKLIEELHPSDKSYIYAEERRLFYIALTRTKNYVYILVPLFKKSKFIKEVRHLL
ncbi:dNA helicase UvrD/REP helicase family [Clostridium sp. CAG:609]|nr:dNA helicase UvrD/REP helicase family [Clostridium sp. CAG:609]